MVVDLNGDGKRDIIATSFNIYEDYLSVWINTTTIAGCPTITMHPTTQSTCTGLSVLLTVAASGNTPLSYQWYKGPTPIGSATAASLAINPITLADAGSYTCVVSNLFNQIIGVRNNEVEIIWPVGARGALQ